MTGVHFFSFFGNTEDKNERDQEVSGRLGQVSDVWDNLGICPGDQG